MLLCQEYTHFAVARGVSSNVGQRSGGGGETATKAKEERETYNRSICIFPSEFLYNDGVI